MLRHPLAVFAVGLALAAPNYDYASAAGIGITLTGLIVTRYEEPTDQNLRPYFNELKRRHVLERLRGFLAPLKLPRPLIIRTAQCGAETMPYKSGGPVTICYELVRHIAAVASKLSHDPKEKAQILFGTFIEAVLHQTAYAVFDQLQVPIWGREDDAADNLAALIMTQFGAKVALTTILGTARFFEYSGHTWTGTDFASPDSPGPQRFYDYLCIAYGADPETFAFLAPVTPRPGNTLPVLPKSRARGCTGEYLKVLHAFLLRIMPYIDPDLLVKVRASQWLRPDETPQ